MFDWLKGRKQPETVADAFILAIYGRNAKKTANLLHAATTAHEELLQGAFERQAVDKLAASLYEGPMPYSTHDLAVSIALGLLKNCPVSQRMELFDIQLSARLTVAKWAGEGKVVVPLAEAFEATLYKEYHPENLV